MTTAPSNPAATRRITPADEAFLRRYRASMKFAIAGPFVKLLDPIRPVKPVRGPSGVVLRKQPTYAATSPESWTIGSRLPAMAGALAAIFGREWGSVLDEEPRDEQGYPGVAGIVTIVAERAKPKRRRGSRGGRGRKPVAS